MNLLDILHEIDDQIGSNTKSLKENPPVVITVTDVPKAVAALKNIENYGKHKQRFVTDFKSAKAKIFGPTSENDVMKTARKDWDNDLSESGKTIKLKEIISRIGSRWDDVKSKLEDKGGEEEIKQWILNSSFDEIRPSGLFGHKSLNYYPNRNINKADLDAILREPMREGEYFTVDGNEIIFDLNKEDGGKSFSQNDIKSIISTIMDTAGVDFNFKSAGQISTPSDKPKTKNPTSTPPTPEKSGEVRFIVTLDPEKLKDPNNEKAKQKKKDLRDLITRLKNTYDKNFEYSNNVITINKVKDNTVKRDLMATFAPYSKKAEVPVQESVNVEYLRMQKLAGVITEAEYQVKLNEGKQVGTLYHFTYIPALRNILRSNVLGDSEGLEYRDEPELYRKNLGSDNKYGRVALTRNKNFSSALLKNHSVCLVLDGDKLSQNSKIKPYQWDPSHFWDKNSEEYKSFVAQHGEDAFEDQMEETIPIIKNLDRYLTKVIIFKNNIEYDPHEDWDPEEFQEVFEDCIEMIKEKNIPYEIR